MASSYDNNLRLDEMATGDGSGTWGTTTNTNLTLIAPCNPIYLFKQKEYV